MNSKIRIKCVQHNMIIDPETGRLPNGVLDVYHHHDHSRCGSETFTMTEETMINRETAGAWLTRPRLRDPS